MAHIYLDYAATTPVDPLVMRAMAPYFSEKFGNPGSLHAFGQEAIAAVDKAREAIAKSIGRPAAAGFREVIFTGSATEANNLALRGAFRKAAAAFGAGRNKSKLRIVISSVEHESVRETAHDLEKEGAEVVEIPVSREGIIDLHKLESALNERTALVSVMYANNEVGTVQPISEISKIIRNFRASRVTGQASRRRIHGPWPMTHDAWPFFHTDAVQAFQFLDCNIEGLGVDMLTLSAHKIYGPKGVGVLYVHSQEQGTKNKEQGSRSPSSLVTGYLSPIVTGGGQEFGLRSGTENVPGIAGFAAAARLAAAARAKERVRLGALREELWSGIKKACPRAEMNGVENSPRTLSGILNVYFPGSAAQELLTKLDIAGLAASAGPACSSRAAAPSHVVHALGHSKKRASESVRFSMGKYTTPEEIREAVRIIADATTS
ncbi:MAG: cysteine desulfurase [Candidatus Liptonbacteria bacterium]|nr:cysteine desulfurase [Candidatus Liptonbacteria bacterium]